jgi:SAM-dependent methyltransferase
MPAFINNIESAREKNISFYNEIADRYESMLEQEASNKIIREIVSDKFTAIVKSGTVLDFGGGTGLDLKWLSANNYIIFFCEPSSGMREKAIAYNKNILQNDKIFFLKDALTNFSNWHNVLPFSEKIDAILSNFAAINCIPNIELLFANLAQVMKPGGNLIALILDYNLKKNKLPLSKKIGLFFSQAHFENVVKDNGNVHTVYIFSEKKIIKASQPYFNFCSNQTLKGYGFCLIHLTRK